MTGRCRHSGQPAITMLRLIETRTFFADRAQRLRSLDAGCLLNIPQPASPSSPASSPPDRKDQVNQTPWPCHNMIASKTRFRDREQSCQNHVRRTGVCHERDLNQKGRERCCTRDEGRPLGVGGQALTPNHCKLLSSKAMVVSVAVKTELQFC